MEHIIIIGLALALDAFGVALGLGCGNILVRKQKLALIFSFAFFQFLLAYTGALVGSYINSNFFEISNYVSGAIILFIGLLLLKEGYEREEACTYVDFTFFSYVVMGISVSIDALGVGFSLMNSLTLSIVLNNSLVIGLISLLMTALALLIVRFIKHLSIVERYADYIGGVILVIFGLNMIL